MSILQRRLGRLSVFIRRTFIVPVVGALLPVAAHASASPWENAVDVLKEAFTGPIARGLSLVAIVLGGLVIAFDEGHTKKQLAGILFGVGMSISAVNFLAWLFP